jgi:hypothetical protein
VQSAHGHSFNERWRFNPDVILGRSWQIHRHDLVQMSRPASTSTRLIDELAHAT